jgi:hypothetical protein
MADVVAMIPPTTTNAIETARTALFLLDANTM